MAEDSFDAPSDYEHASGGDGTNIWMWVGIGCGVILLVVAGALIFGGYKSYSCCKQAMERQKEARETSLEFATDLRDADYESAWDRTTEAFRSGTTLDGFRGSIEAYRERIEGSVPEMVGIRPPANRGGDGKGVWEVDIGFMPHAGETYVVLQLQLAEKGKGEQREFLVADLALRERDRNVATEPPARRIRRFNRLVAEDQIESARGLFAERFEPAQSEEAFQSYVDEHSSVFGAAELEFYSIRYEAGLGATVLAVHRSTGSGETHVQYGLGKPGALWVITDIELNVEPPGPAEPNAGPPDAGTTDAAGTAGDTTGD